MLVSMMQHSQKTQKRPDSADRLEIIVPQHLRKKAQELADRERLSLRVFVRIALEQAVKRLDADKAA